MSEPLKAQAAAISEIEKIESTSLEQAMPYKTCWELFDYAAKRYGESAALTFLPTADINEKPFSWSYADLFVEIKRTANALNHLGIKQGDAVSVILPNLPEIHFSMWGAQLAGVVNPINPMLEPSHIGGIIQAAGSKVVITTVASQGDEIYDKVTKAVSESCCVEHLVLVDPAKYHDSEPSAQPNSVLAEGDVAVHSFDELVAQFDGDTLNFDRTINPSEIASYFHTGGTTGVPKLATHSHLNESYTGWVTNKLRGTEPGQVILCGLPIFHVNGAIVTGLGAFASGSHVVLATAQGYRSPNVIGNFWKLVERYQINTFSCVPTILTTLKERPIDADVSSLQFALVGAAPLSPSLFNQFEADTGVMILEGYGLTEGTCVSAINPADGERKIGSIGLRLPYQELRIAEIAEDQRIHRFCEVGEPGEIVIRGPNVFPGYTDTSKNKGVLLEDGWMATGDLGRLDEDQYVWLTGREKDLIIRGGHNIDPAIIENTLSKHPDVAMVAAVGQLDSYAGEIPVAFVTLVQGAQITEQELRDYAREHISERAAVPNRIEIIEAMPLTAVGKTFKPTLRASAAEFALKKELDEHSISLESLNVYQDPTMGLSVNYTLGNTAQAKTTSEVIGKYAIHNNSN